MAKRKRHAPRALDRESFDWYLNELKDWKAPVIKGGKYGAVYHGDHMLIQEFIERLCATRVTVHRS